MPVSNTSYTAQDIVSRIIFSVSECCVFERIYCEFKKGEIPKLYERYK